MRSRKFPGGADIILPSVPLPRDLGHVLLHLLGDHRRLPDEDAGVPEEFAAVEKHACELHTGLLGEGLHPHGGAVGHGNLGLDVSEVGIRAPGHHAEREQHVVGGGILQPRAHGVPVFVVVFHYLVGGGDQGHSFGVAPEYRIACVCDTGRRVAVIGLQQQIVRRELGNVGENQVAVAFLRHHEYVPSRNDAGDPLVSQPQEGLAGFGKVQELLGLGTPAYRPEPGSEASGHYYTVKVVIHSSVTMVTPAPPMRTSSSLTRATPGTVRRYFCISSWSTPVPLPCMMRT